MIQSASASESFRGPRSDQGQVGHLTAAEFADSYAVRVHRFAAMVTRNDQDSSDLAQEALLKALHGLPRFDPEAGSLEAWVWRIVINTARDAGRLRARRGRLADRWRSEHYERAGQGSVEEDVLRGLRDADLLAAVRALPERARTVIALRYGAQLGTGEIAAQLRMTAPAVSMAIGRALSKLKDQLKEMP